MYYFLLYSRAACLSTCYCWVGECAARRPAPARAGRRAARQPRLSKVRRLTRRQFMKVRIAAFCREFREIRHGESRGERRGGGKAANAELPHEAFAFDLLFSFARGGFQFPAILPHPDKRRRPHEQRFHTCAHMRSPLRGSRLTAALALGKRRSARLHSAQTNRTKIPVRKNPHGYVFVLFYQVDEKSILSFASSAPLISENLWSSCSTVRFFFSSPFTSKII